jgi:hypothetical protein
MQLGVYGIPSGNAFHGNSEQFCAILKSGIVSFKCLNRVVLHTLQYPDPDDEGWSHTEWARIVNLP